MTKGTRFWKKKLLQKTKFFVKLCPIRINFEITIRKSINNTKFVYCWQETFKMGVHTTKCRYPINSCSKFSFFARFFYIKKWKLSIFFLFKGKIYVWMTSIKIISKFREVFSWFEDNKNAINISSLKSWFKFYIDFVKYMSPLLMFVHYLDLHFLQLELLVTNLQNF